jgi:hypothetical protein
MRNVSCEMYGHEQVSHLKVEYPPCQNKTHPLPTSLARPRPPHITVTHQDAADPVTSQWCREMDRADIIPG